MGIFFGCIPLEGFLYFPPGLRVVCVEMCLSDEERIVIRITGGGGGGQSTSVDTSLGELLCELMELTRVPYKISYVLPAHPLSCSLGTVLHPQFEQRDLTTKRSNSNCAVKLTRKVSNFRQLPRILQLLTENHHLQATLLAPSRAQQAAAEEGQRS